MPAKTLAVVSQKGGVDKTTLTFHMACGLAKEGLQILAVDRATRRAPAGYAIRRPGKRQGASDCPDPSASISSQGAFKVPSVVRSTSPTDSRELTSVWTFL